MGIQVSSLAGHSASFPSATQHGTLKEDTGLRLA